MCWKTLQTSLCRNSRLPGTSRGNGNHSWHLYHIFQMCSAFPHTLSQQSFQRSNKLYTLGFIQVPVFRLNIQVAAATKSTFFQLLVLHKLCPFLRNKALATAIQALYNVRISCAFISSRQWQQEYLNGHGTEIKSFRWLPIGF